MINLKGKDSVADAVQSVLNQEATDVDARTKDDIGGRKKTTQKDDVGPSADGKSTKVKLQGESTEKTLADTKPPSSVKTEDPEPREKVDVQAKKENKALKKEEVESLEEKNWIAGAIKKPGAMTAAAKREGESTSEYIKKHEHDSGKAGKRARLAKTLKSFKEEHEGYSIYDQLINEVLSKDASAGQWIHDFVHSDNPKFAGKSKEQRKKQALAAYYAKQRNEETESVEEGVVDTIKKGVKKAAEVLGGPDDEGHKKDLQRKMGIPQTGKQGHAKQNEEVETVEEGWDDMLKDVKAKKGPQPSGGSGVKQGSRYGGGKQKDKPEHDDKKVNEAKKEDDDTPFDPPYSKKSAETTDKSGAKHTPMSRAHHLARSAMSRIKKDLGQKKSK
jgi:hypothetical protein